MFNVFIYLPESDDELYKIFPTTYIDVVKEINDILDFLLTKNNLKIYYDPKNIEGFFKILSKEENIFIIERQFKKNITKKKAFEINNTKDSSATYYRYISGSIINAENILCHISESIFSNSTENLFINIFDVIPSCRNRVFIFKDAMHMQDLPNHFAHINFTSNKMGIETWFSSNPHLNPFSIENPFLFAKTSIIIQGKSVYFEKSTKYFWHLDNLHKNEYEVYVYGNSSIDFEDEFPKNDQGLIKINEFFYELEYLKYNAFDFIGILLVNKKVEIKILEVELV